MCGALCVGVLLRLSGLWVRCWGRLSRRLIVGLAGGWRVDGEVVLPPSGWGGELTPFVGGDGE